MSKSSRRVVIPRLGPTETKSHLDLALVRHRRRAPTNKSLAKSIKKINNKMELKQNDVFQNSVAIDDTAGSGVFTLLNGVATGDTNIARDGDEVHATSIQFRGILVSSSAQVGITFVRQIVFWDSQPNGAPPTMGTLLDLSTITNANFAPYNRNYQKRYKILYDKLFTFNPMLELTTGTVAPPGTNTTSSVVQMQKAFRRKIRLNRTIKYSGDTGAIGDIASNSLYLFQVSNQAANLPVAVAGYRLYFKDN